MSDCSIDSLGRGTPAELPPGLEHPIRANGATVTVLTPSYNYAHFLPECLRSVQEQQSSGLDVQHVVVDDGSTDDSWAVITDLHPQRERDCVRQDNRGLSATLNRALTLARGEWLLWLNADDFLLPDTMRLLAATLQDVPDADLVFGDTLFVDDQSRVVRLVAQPPFDRSLVEGGYNTFHVPSVLWRRSRLTKQAPFDESLQLLMDLDLWLDLTRPGCTTVKVDAAFSAFRRHAAQVSATDRPSDAAEMQLLATRHGLDRLMSAQTSRPLRSATARHAFAKVADGSWLRERALRGHVGRPVGPGTAPHLELSRLLQPQTPRRSVRRT